MAGKLDILRLIRQIKTKSGLRFKVSDDYKTIYVIDLDEEEVYVEGWTKNEVYIQLRAIYNHLLVIDDIEYRNLTKRPLVRG